MVTGRRDDNNKKIGYKVKVYGNGKTYVWKRVDVPHEISAPIVGEIQQTWADDFPRIG